MIAGVPVHELAIAAFFGAVMGVLGYFLTRAFLPVVEKII